MSLPPTRWPMSSSPPAATPTCSSGRSATSRSRWRPRSNDGCSRPPTPPKAGRSRSPAGWSRRTTPAGTPSTTPSTASTCTPRSPMPWATPSKRPCSRRLRSSALPQQPPHRSPRPREQADAANTALLELRRDDQFVTGQLLRISLADGTAEIVNAGHPLPYLLRAGRARDARSSRPKCPLGVQATRVHGPELRLAARRPAPAAHRRLPGTQRRPSRHRSHPGRHHRPASAPDRPGARAERPGGRRAASCRTTPPPSASTGTGRRTTATPRAAPASPGRRSPDVTTSRRRCRPRRAGQLASSQPELPEDLGGVLAELGGRAAGTRRRHRRSTAARAMVRKAPVRMRRSSGTARRLGLRVGGEVGDGRARTPDEALRVEQRAPLGQRALGEQRVHQVGQLGHVRPPGRDVGEPLVVDPLRAADGLAEPRPPVRLGHEQQDPAVVGAAEGAVQGVVAGAPARAAAG